MSVRRALWTMIVSLAAGAMAWGGAAVCANDALIVPADEAADEEVAEQLGVFRDVVEAALDGNVVDVMVGDAVAVPAPIPAAPAVNPAAANAEFEARLAPIKAQFEPLLKSELSFANRVCGWSDEQRRQAIVAGKAWLDQFARGMVGLQHLQQGLLIVAANGPPAAIQQSKDPTEFAPKQLADALRKVLADDQKAAYDAELKRREAFYKAAVIDNLISALDERLDLTAEQRRKIAATLDARWHEKWAPPLESFVHMGEYIPIIPDEYVTPHLSNEQRTLWGGLQKIHFGGAQFGNNLLPAGVVDDIDLNEAE